MTGEACALKCKHCNGLVLRGMVKVENPKKLFEVCEKFASKGYVGCLISGGCNKRGEVPLKPFINTIAKIKRELDMTVFVHTGLIDENLAFRLAEAEVDEALIDIIGSNKTIKEVYNLNATVEDYRHSLEALTSAGIPIVPHVIVGLHYGRLLGEINALKIISDFRPEALVIIALIPLKGTEMENVKPPEPEEIIRVICEARKLMPDTLISLGCMRPKGAHRSRTDKLAVKCGVNAMAFPTIEAIRTAEELNLKVYYSSFCCSQILKDIKKLCKDFGKVIFWKSGD